MHAAVNNQNLTRANVLAGDGARKRFFSRGEGIRIARDFEKPVE